MAYTFASALFQDRIMVPVGRRDQVPIEHFEQTLSTLLGVQVKAKQTGGDRLAGTLRVIAGQEVQEWIYESD